MEKIDGVVVLYNPDISVISNIKSYICYVDKLYVIDNSEVKNSLIVGELYKNKNIVYIFNGENLGIAKALNIAAKLATQNNAQWLLTMDQDSKATSDMMEKLLYFINNNDCDNIGIVSPVHLMQGLLTYTHNFINKDEYSNILTTMTSGNLVNLKIHKKVGGFLEELFIDYVDHEYCLRLNKYGYKVIQLNKAYLLHNLGNCKLFSLGNLKKISYTNHNALRRYYITRNRLYIASLYKEFFPDFIKQDRKAFWLELCKIVLFEKNKINKLISIIRGYCDFKKGILGKNYKMGDLSS